MIAFRRPPSLRNLLVRAEVPLTVPFLPSSMECLGALLDVLLVRNISWSQTPSRVTPLVPPQDPGPHYLYHF